MPQHSRHSKHNIIVGDDCRRAKSALAEHINHPLYNEPYLLPCRICACPCGVKDLGVGDALAFRSYLSCRMISSQVSRPYQSGERTVFTFFASCSLVYGL